MSLVVNNNMMAANTARNLNAHYGRLATSTQRLSSGLRVNSAADDAAGLAIRELQRADIAALQQGARNANDAISMIQVADGSLGIIDEKLIRMKELAEQAATGTYDSTQRLMIESEYQAMASEITRIANATDFNGTKLLDGTLAGDHDGSGLISEGKMKIHFGTGNDSAEDYYYVEIGECTSEAFGLGNNSTWQDVRRRGVEAFKQSLQQQIKNDKTLSDAEKGELLAQIEANSANLDEALLYATDPAKAWELWGAKSAREEVQDAVKAAFAAAAPPADANALKTLVNDAADTSALSKAQAAVDGLAISGAISDDEGTALKSLLKNRFDAISQGIVAPTAPATIGELTSATLDDILAAVQEVIPAEMDGSTGFLQAGKNWVGNSELMNEYLAEANKAANEAAGMTVATTDTKPLLDGLKQAIDDYAIKNPPSTTASEAAANAYLAGVAAAVSKAAKAAGFDASAANDIAKYIKSQKGTATGTPPVYDMATAMTNIGTFLATGTNLVPDATGSTLESLADKAVRNNAIEAKMDDYWSGLRTTERQKLQYAWGQAAVYNLANADPTREPGSYGIGAGEFTFGVGADGKPIPGADAMLEKALDDMKAKIGHMDFAGFTVETQEDAQHALDAINEAIISKDKIRAHLGAAQNRLENTVSNLNIQAENLQAAESRISDVDVATEMTEFVRNQILTQSAVAMLSQANSLPQMAMQLIGG